MQDEHECIFCVVDLHAITVPQYPKELRERTIQTAAMYLACGVDPKKNTLFVQADVAAHAELAWILNTIAKISELKLMHQYKEKSKGKEENISVGLFAYPVLMAADILLYQTELVPVGEEQLQHIELARELARRFNKRFGETFVVPKSIVQRMGARIMALDDPSKKMSKSATTTAGYIALLDTPDVIQKKISRAVTDSGTEIVYSPKKPALSNLLTIYHLLSGIPIGDIEKKYSGKGYKEFKEGLIRVLNKELEPIQKKYATLMSHPDDVCAILKEGAVAARTRADEMLTRVKRAVGLGCP